MPYLLWLLVFLILAFPACSGNPTPLPEAQLLDGVWQALEPYTTSHDRANWEVIESRSVFGREVSERFQEDGPDLYCLGLGPTPPPNQRFSPDATYWYVLMQRRPATPLPGLRLSPTAPPSIPEPHLYQGYFLVDPTTGEIVGRMFTCTVY